MFAYVLRGDQRDADSLLGLAATCVRSGDVDGMRGAYAKLIEFHRGAIEELLRGGAKARAATSSPRRRLAPSESCRRG